METARCEERRSSLVIPTWATWAQAADWALRRMVFITVLGELRGLTLHDTPADLGMGAEVVW